MRAPARQRGVLLIAAVVLIAVAAVMAVVIVTLTAGSGQAGGQHLGSTQALYAAESGLERAVGYLLAPTTTNRSTCAAIPSGTTDVPSIGQYQITSPASTYVTTAITLDDAIAAGTSSPISVVRVAGNTAQLAASGRVLIDREAFDYQSIGTVDADCGGAVGDAPCLRGVIRARDGTTAAAHTVNTRIGQYQCTVTSTGGVPDVANPRGQRVLSQGIQQQEGWAVGNSSTPGTNRATVLRWDGVSWSDVTASLPANANRHLYAVSVLSYADSWTVGETGGNGGGSCTTNRARILNWNGSAWSCNASPSNQHLNSVSMLSAQYGWAAGNRRACINPGPTILIWDGNNWSCPAAGVLPATADRNLNGIYMLSTTDGWAVGQSNGTRPVVLRWNTPCAGGAGTGNWNNCTSNPYVPAIDVDLNSIFMNSANDGWAIGQRRGCINPGPTILRWDGNSWSCPAGLPAAADRNLRAVACATSNDCWAVGDNGTILHWNGSSWTVDSQSGVVTTQRLRGIAIIGARTRPQAAWREVFP